jgi:hypothetical protein
MAYAAGMPHIFFSLGCLLRSHPWLFVTFILSGAHSDQVSFELGHHSQHLE